VRGGYGVGRGQGASHFVGRGRGQSPGRGRGGGGGFTLSMGNQQSQAVKRSHSSISPSRWQTLYDAPLPTYLTNMCKPDACTLCEVPFNGPTISRSHYDGKAHEKKVAQYLAENVADEISRPKKVKISAPTVEETTSCLSCSLCNLVCTSTVVYDSHMQGKAHASKVRAANIAKSGDLGNKTGCSVCNIFVTSQEALTTHLAGKQHRKKSERLLEVEGGLQLHCEECGVTATDRPGLEAHLSGKRHQEKTVGKKEETEEKDEVMVKVDGGEQLHCELCGVTTTDRPGLEAHLSGKKHLAKERRGRGRFCSKCQVGVDTEEAWELHLTGEAHKLVMAKFGPKVIDYNTYDFNSFVGEVKEEVKVDEGQN